jgi:hypothetical protein
MTSCVGEDGDQKPERPDAKPGGRSFAIPVVGDFPLRNLNFPARGVLR